MNNTTDLLQKNEVEQKVVKKKKEQPKEKSLVSTFFRNALRSNLDLTSLADNKAGILISINGFILTVSVTASSFIVHNQLMTNAFIAIILTSLGSIILAVLAVKPRLKQMMVPKEYLDEYESLLYYQDIASLPPKEYKKRTKKILQTTKKSTNEMIYHLHILASEIKKKYFWLKQAYTFFSLGLLMSASLIIYALLAPQPKGEFDTMSSDGVAYKKGVFYNIFEPSGATTLPDGKVMIVEDEGGSKVFKLIEFDENSRVIELGTPYIPKKMKKMLKKSVDDLEAITSCGNTIFAITSFSSNKDNEDKKDRQKLLMLAYDDGTIKEIHYYKKLKKYLQEAFPTLFPKHIFFKSDINIEGLVYDKEDDVLYVGFRSPLESGNAIMIGIKNFQEIFTSEEKPEFTKPLFLNLFNQGIRALAYDIKKDGYWIIGGSSEDRDGEFSLYFYDKKTKQIMKKTPQIDIGFAEGLSIINANSNDSALFLVEDNGKKPNKPANYILINKKGL